VKQQINLLQISQNLAEPILSMWLIYRLWAIFIAGLLIVYAAIFGYKHIKTNQYYKLQTSNVQILESLKQVTGKIQSQNDPSQLVEEIANLTENNLKMAQTLKLLQDQGLIEPHSFSKYLEGFSRRHVEGTWFTDFDIGENGNYMSLKGGAIDALLVPEILQALQGEEVFKGKTFNSLEIEKTSDENTWVKFSLRAQKEVVDKVDKK